MWSVESDYPGVNLLATVNDGMVCYLHREFCLTRYLCLAQRERSCHTDCTEEWQVCNSPQPGSAHHCTLVCFLVEVGGLTEDCYKWSWLRWKSVSNLWGELKRTVDSCSLKCKPARFLFGGLVMQAMKKHAVALQLQIPPELPVMVICCVWKSYSLVTSQLPSQTTVLLLVVKVPAVGDCLSL